MFKDVLDEKEIKTRLSVIKKLDNNAYENLIQKIEFNKLRRLKKMTKQMIKRYLAGGLKEYNKRIGVEELISIVNKGSHKRKILYISSVPPFNLMRQSAYLRKSGEFETILLMEGSWVVDFIENFFDTVYVYDSVYTLTYILKEVKPDIIHIQGQICTSEYFSILAKLLNKTKVIFEFYDIASLCLSKEDAKEIWKKADVELGYFSERFACKKCDGLIFGYSSEAVDILKSRYAINNPILEFHSYTCDEFISVDNGKYSDIDSKIHLVYGGFVAPSYLPDKFFGDVKFHSLIEKLTNQQIYFDIYISPYIGTLRIKQMYGAYLNCSKKNQFFKFKKGLPLNEATTEFSKYDFGTMIWLFDKGTFMEDHNQNRMLTKVFTYLEAGIPILISEEAKYVAKLVKDYEIGIVVSQKDLDNLNEIINSYDREKLKANVRKAREELSMKRHIGRLIDFYDEVYNNARIGVGDHAEK